MKQVFISDATMKQSSENFRLSFKEKIELSKLLDRLGVDFIELEGIKNARTDALQIKSIAAAVTGSGIAVPVELNRESVERTWAALSEAKSPRLQVTAPASAVQIEYLYHKKPDALLSAVKETVETCLDVCSDVEFIVADATRADGEFLKELINTAIDAGAGTVTLSDTAGTALPFELSEFIKNTYKAVPALEKVKLGISCANTVSMADASAVAAISCGACQICAAAYPINNVSLYNVAKVLCEKSDALAATSNIRTVELLRTTERIAKLCQPGKKSSTALIGSADSDGADVYLTSHDDLTAVSHAVSRLGYDLSDEDTVKVYNAFLQIASRKDRVGLKELDAIVASYAMQVPSTYKLDTYVITSGNTISATAHIKLTKNGAPVEGVYIGDGSIDAAFQAIEKITGCHYELDDFELQAVTEGREAMGQTVVKLRSGGKVYSGRGISTDIVGAGIQAYLSALNKIIYEEEVE